LTVYDGRNQKSPTRQRYDGLAALVIEVGNEVAKSMEQIRAEVAGRIDTNEGALTPVMNELTDKRVLYEERGKYFTLAIPENPYL